MKQGKLKKMCSLLITTVLLMCYAMQYMAPVSEVQAEASDEPVYSADTEQLYEIKSVASGCTYENGVLTVPTATDAGITTELPADASYFMTMKIKVGAHETPYVNLGTREGAYLHIQKSGYYVIGSTDEAWKNGTVFANMQSGEMKVTINSTPKQLTVWVDGNKVIESTYATEGKAAKPNFTWNQGGVTASDIRIWTVKSVDEPEEVSEPVYDEAMDMEYQILSVGENSTYVNGVLVVPNATDAGITTDLSADASYFMTMKIKVGAHETPYVNLGTREGAYLHMQKSGYEVAGSTDAAWKSGTVFANMQSGEMKVTVSSTPEQLTVWVDGTKVIESTYATEGKSAKPNFTWSQGGVTASDIKIWTKNTTDEPTYNDETDILYDVESISGTNVSYTDGIATVPDKTGATINCGLAGDAAYYMSMYVKVGTETTDTKYANIGTRNDGYIQLQAAGYKAMGVVDPAWVNKTMSDLTGDGVRVTVYSSSKCMKVWVNGEKIVDDIYATFGKAAKPGITWNQGGVTLSHIKVWSPKAELEGASLTLDGNIGVNFFVQMDKNALSNTSVELTFPDKTVKTISTANAVFDSTEGAYKFTCDVAAKEMTEDVTIKFLDGEKVLDTCTYSVKAYADTILTNTEYAQYAPLVKAMLNYGATSQQYFDYNTDVLANKDLDPAEQVITPVEEGTLSVYAPVTQQDDTIGKIVGASLILESQTTLKIFFKLNADINPKECIVTYGQKQLNWVKSGDYQCVMIENINAADLDSNYSFTIKYHDDITFEVSYNPMTYCYNVIKQGTYSEKLNQLVYALCKYNTVANSYVVE